MISRLTINSYQSGISLPRKTGVFAAAVREAAHFGSPDSRFWLSLSLVSVSLIAIVVYVVVVNSILLNGEAIKRQTGSLREVERDYLRAKSALARRESPAWLEEQSKNIGMIEALDVRFVSRDEKAVALSR